MIGMGGIGAVALLLPVAEQHDNNGRHRCQGLEFSNTSNRNWQFSNCNYLLTL
ncbi:hypothetical protein PF008_g32626 [Phytophthora fragariae]|uniref:Uncharacterized protein n=1 Tax=Phytophthora fragariae TaxID=53985 RepID=A0A6G0PZA5_9STRA|nr:hypothetical protein PF008_g32626 [Phytophthora fragariae]